MKKISKKQKLIMLISILTIVVIIGLVVGINAFKVNILNGKYNSSNGSSSNGNLLPEYIKKGITLGGVTGTLEDLDTSDATATPEDILYGKTAYVDGKKITGTYRTIGMLQIGDYVDYVPDSASEYSLSNTYSGYTSSQTISQEDLSWQVLSIEDDGTVDLISSMPTTQNIGLGNAVGYNNGVFLLNDICKKLYSNSKLDATARNLNIEDIEKHMTDEGLNYVHNYEGDSVLWGKTKLYMGSGAYYPNLYIQENGAGINSTSIKEDGIGVSENFYNEVTTESFGENLGKLTVTQTYYYNLMNSNYYKEKDIFYNLIHNVGEFWLASRGVDALSKVASFGIRKINSNYFSGSDLTNSALSIYNSKSSLRVVVSLNANTEIIGGDGKSDKTAYQIKQ